MMMKIALSLMMATLVIGGCGGDSTTPVGGDGGSDGSTLPPDDCTSGDSHFYVVNVLDIAQEMDGVSAGYNLDDRVSDVTDDEGCNQDDFTSPEGVEGVDNALAVLLPILNTFAGDISATIQENVNSGSILVLVEMTNVDDFTNDACVGLNLYVGEMPGDIAPDLTDGLLSPGQTIDISPESLDAMGNPLVTVSGATITGGSVAASTPVISLPIPLEDGVVLQLNIRDARVGGTFTATTMQDGIIAGVLSARELSMSVEALDLGVTAETVEGILEAQADMQDESGECKSLSATLIYNGVNAVRGGVATVM